LDPPGWPDPGGRASEDAMRHLLVLLAAPTLLLALAACGDGGAAPDAQPILDAQLVPDAGVTDAGGMPPDAGPAADAGAQADASSCAATAVPASAPNVMVSSTAADVFPAPTGPFAIATHRMHLVDPARGEDYTEDPDDHRELMIQLYYPTDQRGGPVAPLVEAEVAEVAEAARGWPARWWTQVKTHATYDAPLSAARARWPVILYTHSRLGFRFEQQAIVEQLASEGAIVVTVSIPYLGGPVVFPDGRVVDPVPAPPLRTLADVEPFDRVVGQEIEQARRDLAFVLDTLEGLERGEPCGFLTGRLDLAHLGAFGFSMGGGASISLCLSDARCKAAIDLDGGIPGVTPRATDRPLMLMLADRTAVEFEAILDQATGPAYRVRLSGAAHGNFNGLSGLLAQFLPTLDIDRWLGSRVPWRPASEVVAAYVHAFFGRYVLDVASAPLLDAPRSPFGGVFAEKSMAGVSAPPLSIVGTSLRGPLNAPLPTGGATVAVSALGLSTRSSSIGGYVLGGLAPRSRVAVSIEHPELAPQLTDVEVGARSVFLPNFVQLSARQLDLLAATGGFTRDPTKGDLFVSTNWQPRVSLAGPVAGVRLQLASGAPVSYVGAFNRIDLQATATSSTAPPQAAAFGLVPGSETVTFSHPRLDCVPLSGAAAAPGTHLAAVTLRAGFATFLNLACR